MNKKLLLLGIVLLVLLAGGITYAMWPKQTNKKAVQGDVVTTAGQTPAKPATGQALDQKASDGLKNMLTIISNYYSKQGGGYPPATADGWKQILSSVYTDASFVNPYTKTFYGFTNSETPTYGQVQYGPGKSCKDNKFVDANYRSLALRTKTVAGYDCESITVQNGSQTQ